ncbi:MAG: MBL fold metallo-hydrolase [Clostridia bacterium]|nr:MBL fold metallo-hydrolase [Clostridia bacterium]
MRICVLASGSKGNTTYIEGDNTRLLIDAGLSCSDIEDRLLHIGVNPSQINGVLITHEHSDHIRGLHTFARKYSTNIYAHHDTWQVLDAKLPKIATHKKIDILSPDFSINELDITAFDLDHDASHCLGYSIMCRTAKISQATDLGHITDPIIRQIMDSSLIVLESNHDVDTLLNCRYPLYLKNRILSNHGHLSNKTSSEAVAKMLGYGVRGVILSHLSEESNTPRLALDTFTNTLSRQGADWVKEIHLDVGHQNKIGNIYKIKE